MITQTVDMMLLQVTGAILAAVSCVVWLWVANVRRWWPFNHDILGELREQHARFEAVRSLTATARQTARGAVTAVTGAAGRARAAGARHGWRGGSPAMAVIAHDETCDEVHGCSCVRHQYGASRRRYGRRVRRDARLDVQAVSIEDES